ncbi:unnamed protein product [Vitrella brassicaformis CCMP3155]|uniref:Protein kinase domain-containing protein n=1 Tax=Vitrella brassicaformis (strain CCMP3155) TaxID=1169540 RepID=A0A0G4GF25_VITBC|nr:unnamed protein product [Vitrella brassicaformis CCMP3155]|eukprot:CEM28114.1 unnamed protein product [Vitrella brassicaformis CCMP3155]
MSMYLPPSRHPPASTGVRMRHPPHHQATRHGHPTASSAHYGHLPENAATAATQGPSQTLHQVCGEGNGSWEAAMSEDQQCRQHHSCCQHKTRCLCEEGEVQMSREALRASGKCVHSWQYHFYELEDATHCFRQDYCLGAGVYGTVFKGNLRGHECAILQIERPPLAVFEKHVYSCRHPCLVAPLAWAVGGRHGYLIYDRVPGGEAAITNMYAVSLDAVKDRLAPNRPKPEATNTEAGGGTGEAELVVLWIMLLVLLLLSCVAALCSAVGNLVVVCCCAVALLVPWGSPPPEKTAEKHQSRQPRPPRRRYVLCLGRPLVPHPFIIQPPPQRQESQAWPNCPCKLADREAQEDFFVKNRLPRDIKIAPPVYAPLPTPPPTRASLGLAVKELDPERMRKYEARSSRPSGVAARMAAKAPPLRQIQPEWVAETPQRPRGASGGFGSARRGRVGGFTPRRA